MDHHIAGRTTPSGDGPAGDLPAASGDGLPPPAAVSLPESSGNDDVVGDVGGGVLAALGQILQVLKDRTGHDFSPYKSSTLVRRIQRRMHQLHSDSVAHYLTQLAERPLEGRLLIREFLIGVTRFFRDTEVWEHLRAEVIPALLAALPEDGAIRVWIPGCATGEDAYSLGMLLIEGMEASGRTVRPRSPGRSPPIQIFATDLNQVAIDRARRGIFPGSIAGAVGEARLARFFTPHERGYLVNLGLRELITFAPHSLLVDPPFTRIDLLICRNLLIYLDPSIHDVLLPRFHYSLNPGGFLVLGSSESIGSAGDLFTAQPLPGNLQIYRRLEVPSQSRRWAFSTRAGLATAPALPPVNDTPMSATDLPLPTTVGQMLLDRFGPAALVVSTTGEIVQVSGRLEPYLTTLVDRAGRSHLDLLREGLREEVRRGIEQVQQVLGTIHRRGAYTGADGRPQVVDLSFQPMPEGAASRGLILVLFIDDPVHREPVGISDGTPLDQAQARIRALEADLRQARRELQVVREEMQISREELTSTNEELQSTNEELTTSAEELRTMNEELVRARAAAEQSLSRYTDLFDAAPVGYFTLDAQGSIVQANAAGSGLLGLAQDRLAGSPFGLFVREIDRSTFRQCLGQAFATAIPQACEVALWREEGPARIIHLSAQAAADGATCRVVATDLSEIRQAETKLRERDEALRMTITASRLGLWHWNLLSGALEWSDEVKVMYGLAPDEPVTLERARGLVHPDDRAGVQQATARTLDGGLDLTHEYRVVWPDGSVRWIAAQGRVYRDGAGNAVRMTGVTCDITARKESERALALERAKLQTAFENMATAVFLMDGQGANLWTNSAGKRLLGLSAEAAAPAAEQGHIEGYDLLDEGGRLVAPAEWPAMRALRGEYLHDVLFSIRHSASGRERRCFITVAPVRDGEGQVVQLVCTVHDVSERYAAEAAHRASQAIIKNLELALDEHALVSIADQAGRIIYVNDKFCAVSQYSRAELLGQDHRLINSTCHTHEFMGELWETLLAGRTWKGEICNRAKDGTLYWVDTTIVPFRGADGIPYQYVAIRNDITQRREAEAKLARNLRFLKAVTESFPGLVAHWTKDLRCTFANQSYLTWFGRRPEEMIGLTKQEVLGPDLFADAQGHIAEVLEGKIQVFPRTMVKANGQVGYLLAQLIPDVENGEIKGFYVLLTDITAIRQAEQALQRTGELLESSQALAQVGGWELDVHTRTVFWTRETQRIHGTGDQQGTTSMDAWLSRYPGESGQRLRAALELALREGRGFDLECALQSADGAAKSVHITSQVIEEGGAVAKVLGSVQDITERCRLQQDLSLARDRALEASRLKSEFLSTMSHEIRTPMNGVIGVTELLQGTPLDAQQQELVEILRSSGANLMVIINDILDFARIEAGKVRIDDNRFHLEKVIEETRALLAPRALAKGLDLYVQVDPLLAEPLCGDGGRIRQVLTNLMGNALKFTDTGVVTVVAGVIGDLDGWRSLRVEVGDTGPGIAPDQQRRLFEPFSQGDGSFTRKHGGTGLGLAISRQLVELMGGTIGFTSTPGRGSTFWFQLTLAVAQGPGTPPAGIPAMVFEPATRPLRLLVADDNVANRQVAHLMLSALGHTVDLVEDGAKALARLAAGRYDVVILDCQMPVMDGYETARRIRAGTIPGVPQALPLIALTAAAMTEDRVMTRAAGMDDHLTKPIRLQDLRAAFQRLGLA